MTSSNRLFASVQISKKKNLKQTFILTSFYHQTAKMSYVVRRCSLQKIIGVIPIRYSQVGIVGYHGELLWNSCIWMLSKFRSKIPRNWNVRASCSRIKRRFDIRRHTYLLVDFVSRGYLCWLLERRDVRLGVTVVIMFIFVVVEVRTRYHVEKSWQRKITKVIRHEIVTKSATTVFERSELHILMENYVAPLRRRLYFTFMVRVRNF